MVPGRGATSYLNVCSSMGCEFGHHLGYHLILVDIPTQCENPRVRDFWYHLIFVGIPSQTWSSTGVGILISSDPCAKSKSIWSFRGWKLWYHLILVDSPNQSDVPWGVGILTSSDPCGQPKSLWRKAPTGADTSSRAETRLWEFHFVNQRSLDSTGMISSYTNRESSWFLLGQLWLVCRYLPHIFWWLGVAPALDPAVTLTAACLGHIWLGQNGPTHIPSPGDPDADTQQGAVVQEICFASSQGSKCTRHQHFRFLKQIKNAIYQAILPHALQYLVQGLHTTPPRKRVLVVGVGLEYPGDNCREDRWATLWYSGETDDAKCYIPPCSSSRRRNWWSVWLATMHPVFLERATWSSDVIVWVSGRRDDATSIGTIQKRAQWWAELSP